MKKQEIPHTAIFKIPVCRSEIRPRDHFQMKLSFMWNFPFFLASMYKSAHLLQFIIFM